MKRGIEDAFIGFVLTVFVVVIILGAIRINKLQATNAELRAQLADCRAAEVAFIAIAPEG